MPKQGGQPAGHFHAKDRAAWRAWLETHHATAPEIRLVFYKKATGKACATYDEAVEEALCFGWIDGVVHRIDDERFSYRFTPRRPKSVWSESNKRRIAKLTAAGLMHPAGQKCVDEAHDTGMWEKPARAVMPEAMPPELAAGFAKSKKARAAYDKLSPGVQRDWQRYVHQAKQQATRDRRAAHAIQMLVEGGPHPWLLGRTVEKQKEAARVAAKAKSRKRRRTTTKTRTTSTSTSTSTSR